MSEFREIADLMRRARGRRSREIA